MFDYIVPVDLSHMFKRYKYLPGVVKTSLVEKWFKADLIRTVFFDDGNSAKEHLKSFKNPEYFSYTISEFTSPLKFLISDIFGSWTFVNDGSKTNVTWIYDLHPKNTLAGWLIKAFVINDLKIFLNNSFNIVKSDLERNKNQ